MTTVAEQASAPGIALDRRRYPGVRSFQEPDSGRFFGRARAADELLLRVLSVRLLLQFAPSGAGKTSLLNAGLFPRLRPHGYLPFTIRLNQAQESLAQAVARSLRDAARTCALRDPVIPEDADSVWDLLAGAQLWSQELILLTPVLVFDQFEEVFTLRDEAFRKDFAVAIGALSQGRRAPLQDDGTSAPAPDAKIIISLREEYLGMLEELSAAIPDLFRERLRLSPLTPAEAREAMVEPARLEGDWLSPPFTFDTACLDALIDFIDGASERIRVIEPLTLQIVCQHAETMAMARAREAAHPELVLENFGGQAGLERLVHHYYSGVLARTADRTTRKRVAALFEDGLLDPAGKRLMMEHGEIQREYNLDDEMLNALVDSRLLRREPRNESVFYEISHDRLTEAIARHRSARLPRWARQALGVAGILILMLIGSLVFVNRARRDAETARENAEIAREGTARALGVLYGDEHVRRLREAGLSETLHQAVKDAPADATSDALASALLLRRQGELAWERDTLADARQTLEEALAAIDRAAVDGVVDGSRQVAIGIERAQILKLLGDVDRESGELAQSESRYTEAVRLWDEVPDLERDPANQLHAVETRMALASLREQTGDLARTESEYVTAVNLALDVLKRSYHQGELSELDEAFLLGRAMYIYADGALNLARVWLEPEDVEGARMLASEALRLRPLSAQARVLRGTASAMYGVSLLFSPDRWKERRSLFDEASAQFAELMQFDPRNRRMSRERAVVQLLTAENVARCAAQPECRQALQPGELESAENRDLDSLGRLQQIADADQGNRSYQGDLAWSKEILARLRSVRKAPEDAVRLLDEALTHRRAAVGGARDHQGPSNLVQALILKAQVLRDNGKATDGYAVVQEALAAADQMPDGILRTFRLIDAQNAKAEALESMKRVREAEESRKEVARLSATIGTPWTARRDKGRASNAEGNAIFNPALKLSGPGRAREMERAAAKYREALVQNMFDPSIWTNLRRACSEAADELSSTAGSSSASNADSQGEEAARRCALESAWMSWVLSDDDSRAQRLQSLYAERRSLGMLLRNDESRRSQALWLAEQGVREAEALEKQDPSPVTLFVLGDAYFGLGLTRERLKAEGWEPAFRAALGYGEQFVSRQRNDPTGQALLGMIRGELANRLDSWGRPGGPSERTRARAACAVAARLAKTAQDKAWVTACDETTQR